MTQSFDDFYEENKDVFDPCVWRSAEKAFEAGQQSKQSEIDDHIKRRLELAKEKQGLINEIDELRKQLESNDRVFKKLQDQMVSHACESDDLQKRIDLALNELENIHFFRTENSDNAINILKGTTNEQ